MHMLTFEQLATCYSIIVEILVLLAGALIFKSKDAIWHKAVRSNVKCV